MGLRIENLSGFPLRQHNIVSLKSITVEIPIGSIFSADREVDIIVHRPRIRLKPNILKKAPSRTSTPFPFTVRAIRIVNGDLMFRSEKLFVNLTKFSLDSVQQKGETVYQLQAPHLRAVFPISGDDVTVAGNTAARFKRQGREVRLNSFVWNTRDFKVSAHGRLSEDSTLSLNSYFQGNPRNLLWPLLKDLTVSGFFYGNATLTLGTDRILRVSGKFNSNVFNCEDETLEKLKGRVSWDSKNKHLKIDTHFNHGSVGSVLRIYSLAGKTRLEGASLAGYPVSRIIDIDRYVPLNSIVDRGEVEIFRRQIKGRVRLRSGSPSDARFNAGGDVDFLYDTKRRLIQFDSTNLTTEFGSGALNGRILPEEDRVSIGVDGRIRTLEGINKYTRHFLSLDLAPWRLRAGNGRFSIQVLKEKNPLRVTTRFTVEDFTCREVPVDRISGRIGSEGENIDGTITVEDPSLRGQACLRFRGEQQRFDFTDVDGEARNVLELLEIDLPLEGRARGSCALAYPGKGQPPHLSARVSAPRLDFFGIPFETVHGNLLSDLEDIRLEGFTYRCLQGTGTADVDIDFQTRRYRMQGRLRDFAVEKIDPRFHGRGDVTWQGKGEFERDPIRAEYAVRDFSFYKDRPMNIRGQLNALTDFSQYRVLTAGHIHLSQRHFPFNISASNENDTPSGEFKIHLKDINQLLPWANNIGRMVLNGQYRIEPDGRLSTQGIAIFNGKVLVIPNFPHALQNFQALVTFKDSEFTLSSIEGELARGRLEGSGRVKIGPEGAEALRLNISLRDSNLYLMDRTSAKVDADLILKKEDETLLLQGTVNLLSADWKREVDEDIQFLAQAETPQAGRSFLDLLRFDLDINGRNDILMDNAFGKMDCTLRLKLTGNLDFPILNGTVESRQGEIFFSDRTFSLIKAKLIFNNKFTIDPLIDIDSEAFISNYRIRFNIKGTASKPRPEFISSPPLPAPDILALISLGELFERPTSSELSSQIGTTGLITDALTENLERRVKKLFGIDILKIDPMINGTTVEGQSRLSVGKSIAKNFVIVYSTNISSTRQEILYLLYQISPSLSIIGMRHADGHYSMDLRFRTRR